MQDAKCEHLTVIKAINFKMLKLMTEKSTQIVKDVVSNQKRIVMDLASQSDPIRLMSQLEHFVKFNPSILNYLYFQFLFFLFFIF